MVFDTKPRFVLNTARHPCRAFFRAKTPSVAVFACGVQHKAEVCVERCPASSPGFLSRKNALLAVFACSVQHKAKVCVERCPASLPGFLSRKNALRGRFGL